MRCAIRPTRFQALTMGEGSEGIIRGVSRHGPRSPALIPEEPTEGRRLDEPAPDLIRGWAITPSPRPSRRLPALTRRPAPQDEATERSSSMSSARENETLHFASADTAAE